jgi:hypothetical protein
VRESRANCPSAEHATLARIRCTTLPEILGTSLDGLIEDALYRVLDKLHPQGPGLHQRSLFDPGLRRGKLSTARSTSTFRFSCNGNVRLASRPTRLADRRPTNSGFTRERVAGAPWSQAAAECSSCVLTAMRVAHF